jgi:hypothetical protein
MFNPDLPSSNGPFPFTTVVLRTNVLPQYLPPPAVMVPRDPDDLDPGLIYSGQLSQYPEAMPWNDSLPFEPEIEQVSIDHQTPGDRRDSL